MIFLDIHHFPTSSQGHTHGLIIFDIFSFYISFIPIKSSSADQIKTAFESYLSMHGIPEIVFTHNKQFITEDFQNLLSMANIKQIIKYPHSANITVDSQIEKFQRAYRSALLTSKIFNNKEWHQLYPLIIIQFNKLVSEFGLNRKMINFQEIIETQLPIITEIPEFPYLSHILQQTAYRFRSKLQKFLSNKQPKTKKTQLAQTNEFNLHELVKIGRAHV